MAIHGFVLLRNQASHNFSTARSIYGATKDFGAPSQQGTQQNESNVQGQYLTGEQQCNLSECFGAGALHSTHAVHPEAPGRDVFRLSNDERRGFGSRLLPQSCRLAAGNVVTITAKPPEIIINLRGFSGNPKRLN
jgi:hypothetical protein